MRIGVLSDTHLKTAPHGFIRALRVALGEVELVLHCGDWVSPAVMEAMEAEGWDVIGVAGNMDSPELHRRLPVKRELEVGGIKVGLLHGWGSPEGIETKVSRAFGDVEVVVFGHTHRPYWGRFGNLWLMNPGAACGWGNPQGPTVGILEAGDMVRGSILKLEAVGQ